MKTCFSIMPFGEGFKDIDKIIRKAAEECGYNYVRGDLTKKPGKILPQIVHEIRCAAVVVADLSDHNPNVFYELGIAHQLLGDDRVVIINQKNAGPDPFDVHQFRQLRYSNSAEGRRYLRKELSVRLLEAAKSSADRENWDIIRGRLARTKMIVRDLKLLLDHAGERGIKQVTFRIVAGLSSLAISDYEPADPNEDQEYFQALAEERDTLREALVRGARLKAVINPPRRFARALLPKRLCKRFERLIRLLDGSSDMAEDSKAAADDMAAMKRCEFAISPVAMPNLFIIGDTIAYEGMKRGGSGGFEMTHWETDADALRGMIKQFDSFFDDSRRDMAHMRPPDGEIVKQLQEFYDEARGFEM